MRYLLIAILVCGVVVLGATALGRAIDQELQQRILFTQNGATLDCRRDFSAHGSVSYSDCHVVP
jgi:hypothetical protein